MARTKISEFSATPGNNTDIDGINIAEGCAPSGINDAIRELMSQLKDFQAGTAGDSFNGPVGTTTAAAGAFTTLSASSTVSGAGFSTYLASPPAIGGTAAAAGSFTTLSASSTVTLSGGTANGVLYLNGSKVATSGSALTFDGTNLSTTGRLNTGANIGVLLNNATGAEILWQYNGTAIGEAGSANQILSGGSSTDFAFTSRGASSSLVFGVNTYEQMRLTSTGLGIGTTTINNKLEVGGVIAVQRSTNTAKVSTLSNESGNFVITADSTYNMIFNTGGGEKMRLDSSGNLGLGVTPNGSWKFEASNGSSDVQGRFVKSGTDSYAWGVDSSGSWSGAGGSLSFRTGGFTSASERARIDSSGNFNVGGTLALGKIYSQTSAAGYAYYAYGNFSSGAEGGIYTGASYLGLNCVSNHALTFATNNTERARIDSSGNLLVGKTATAFTTDGLWGQPEGTYWASRTSDISLVLNRNGTDGQTAQFYKAGTQVGNISVTTTATTYNTSSDYRLKENIQPMTGALAKVAALKPCTYKWKSDGSDGEGFIAHELQAVVPQCVTGEKDAVDEDGKPVYQGIDTSFLVATLTAAIQEQQAIITDLRARVAQLEAK